MNDKDGWLNYAFINLTTFGLGSYLQGDFSRFISGFLMDFTGLPLLITGVVMLDTSNNNGYPGGYAPSGPDPVGLGLAITGGAYY